MAVQYPNVTVYGSSFGTKNGSKLTSFSSKHGEIDLEALNKNVIIDGVEFNTFEETVRDFVLARLGHPVIRVELTPFQIKTAIDEACTEIHYHAPFWAKQFAVFDASAGYNTYEIPRFILDNIEYVAYRKTVLSIQEQAGTLEYDLFLNFFSNNYTSIFSNTSVGQYLLILQYMETIRKVLSLEGSWEVINNQYLQIHPTPTYTPEAVIIEYRAVDSNTIHPKLRNWLQRYTLAICKMILGEIRGKYSLLPSPGGGVNLNGDKLKEEGLQEKNNLKDELVNEITEPPLPFTIW